MTGFFSHSESYDPDHVWSKAVLTIISTSVIHVVGPREKMTEKTNSVDHISR